MNRDNPRPPDGAYRASGVDTGEAGAGLDRLVERITPTWPPPGAWGAVRLPIGYFANVIELGGLGLAISTDGVGSKSIIAERMGRYDTIGIDCVAMNVNDLICVGARPLSLVDYIAVERADALMLDRIAIGLAEGAKEAGISICGGEIAQLEDVVRGFDLAATAVGSVALDKILTGRDAEPGDAIIGIASSGIHSNGLSLARNAFFKREKPLPLDFPLPRTGVALGEELLRPTFIYVREIMEILERVSDVKALIHITGDGLLNLNRIENDRVGFRLDALPEAPEIFTMIEEYGRVRRSEMFEVYNMGVGFCVIVSPKGASAVLSILKAHGRKAQQIGEIIEDATKGVYLTREKLVGHKKAFRDA